MNAKWTNSKFTGVRFREHKTRKNGVKKDRYFVINYYIPDPENEGKRIRVEESLGWASQTEMTEERAARIRSELIEAQKLGLEKPLTLKEKRESEQTRRAAEQTVKEEQEKVSLTFSDIFNEYYYPQARLEKSKAAYEREEQLFRLWAEPAIGHLTLKQIAASELSLQAVRKRMIEGKKATDQIKANKRTEKTAKQERTASPRSIQYCMGFITQVFNFARRAGLYSGNNPEKGGAKERKTDNKRFRFLSHEEAEQLLAALQLRSQDAHDMALLSLDCGLRAGEVFKLTWGDINTEKGLMVLRDTKSGKTRFAYMTGRIKEMLSGRGEGSRDQLVFPGRKDKQAVRISATFEKTVKDLGFNQGVTDPRQKVVFHTLRHTYASWLVQNGVNLYTVQKLLGHSTISQTERYSHLAPSTLQDAVKVLEKSIEMARNPEQVRSGQ